MATPTIGNLVVFAPPSLSQVVDSSGMLTPVWHAFFHQALTPKVNYLNSNFISTINTSGSNGILVTQSTVNNTYTLSLGLGDITPASLNTSTSYIGTSTGVSFNAITGLSKILPLPDTTLGAIGSSATVARADHTHPLSSIYATAFARTAISDTNYTITGTNNQLISYTSITAPRNITLPPATKVGQIIYGADESGSLTATNYISLTCNGTDTIEGIGGSNIVLIDPWSTSGVISNGNGQWDVITKARPFSAGVLHQPGFVDNGNGSVTIDSTGIYAIYRDADGTGDIYVVKPSGLTITFAAASLNYVVLNWNGGSPQIQSTQDVTIINETTVIPLGTIYCLDTSHPLRVLLWDQLGDALVNKIHQSIVKTQRYRLQSGLALSESATRIVNVTSGIVWVGAVEVDLATYASNSQSLYQWNHNSSGQWVNSVVTQYNNGQYDTPTGLVNLNNGRYTVCYIYRSITNINECHMTLGTANYTLANAIASQPQQPPSIIANTTILVGRIIVQRNDATATEIDSAFNSTFYSVITDHNSLSNLQGGTTSQYYHLTTAQYNQLSSMVLGTVALVGGSSFTITSSSATDTSTVAYQIYV